MNTIFVYLFYVGLVAPIFAQWVVYYDDYLNNLPDFLDGANEEQTEQFKRIVSDRSLSAAEYNQQMDALIAQLDPTNQEKYMQPEREAKEGMQKVSAKFLELVSHLPKKTKRIAQQLVDTVMASGQLTPQEMNEKMDAILSKLPPDTVTELMGAYYEATQFVNNNNQ